MNDLLELGGMVEESFEGEGKGAKGKEESVGGDLRVRDKRLGGRVCHKPLLVEPARFFNPYGFKCQLPNILCV